MNGFGFFIFAATIFGAAVFIPWAIRYDRIMAELESLDDEMLATAAADAWNRGEWA